MLSQGAAQFEPAQVYEQPFDVLRDMTLSRPEKIEILHQWLTDVVRSRSGDRVCAVTKALQFLGAPVELS